MSRSIFVFALLLLSISSLFAQHTIKDCHCDKCMTHKIGQLLVVGFVGLEPDTSIIQAIDKYSIGGVIYFDKNVSHRLPQGGYGPRNIASVAQLSRLSDSLQSLARQAGLPPLFITIDQEGGRVNRLKSDYGFAPSVSAKRLGKLNNDDSTAYHAMLTAQTLHQAGINVNYTPCVDLDINPLNPIIGKVERSFSANGDTVARHAAIWIDQHNKQQIITSLKHFPGHGSSKDDSHLGLPDISKTWSEKELIPYQTLIGRGYDQIVMVGHLMIDHLDKQYPASLSEKIINQLLRQKLAFKGVIATDDLNMGAIVDNFSLENALCLALNAGVEMIVMGNNAKVFQKDLIAQTVVIIKNLISCQKVSLETIDQAYVRISELKSQF